MKTFKLDKSVESVIITISVLGFLTFFTVALNTTTVSDKLILFGNSATMLFITVTSVYAKTARGSLQEAQKSREISQDVLLSSEKARRDQQRPVLCMRWLWSEKGSMHKRHTCLMNIGSGPALSLEVYWNFVRYNGPFGGVEFSKHLERALLDQKVFNAPLGVTTSFDGMHISFYESESESRTSCYTPLTSDYFIALVRYYDVYRRQYITVIDGEGTTTKLVNNSTFMSELESLNTISAKQVKKANSGTFTLAKAEEMKKTAILEMNKKSEI